MPLDGEVSHSAGRKCLIQTVNVLTQYPGIQSNPVNLEFRESITEWLTNLFRVHCEKKGV